MNEKDFNSMLEHLANGWTKREYEKVAGHFSEELFYSDSLNYAFHDNRSLLEFFRDDEGQPQVCTFHDAIFDESRQCGVAEYTYEGTYRYHGTVWIGLKDDKIESWREYQHKSEKNWEEFWNR